MRGLIYIVLVLLTIISCDTEKPKGLEYIFIRRKGTMDTIRRELLSSRQTDTFNIISYKTTWDKDVSEQEFIFPIEKKYDSLTSYKLLDSTTIEFEDKEYKVFKYLYDDKDASDEELLYFYSPDFGIVIFRWAWWGNYDRLTRTGDSTNDRIIFYLEEMIMNNDREFFIKWN